MSEIGVGKESGRGRETEHLCRPLGTESEREKGRENGEEVQEVEEEEAVEEDQVEEVEERIWGVFRC